MYIYCTECTEREATTKQSTAERSFKTKRNEALTDWLTVHSQSVSQSQCHSTQCGSIIHFLTFFIFDFWNIEMRNCILNTSMRKSIDVGVTDCGSGISYVLYNCTLCKNRKKKTVFQKCHQQLHKFQIPKFQIPTQSNSNSNFLYISTFHLYSPISCFLTALNTFHKTKILFLPKRKLQIEKGNPSIKVKSYRLWK